ncbi:MucBP domain-containing protein, partial [Streptococcus suis]
MNLNKNVKKAKHSEHKARFRKVAGIGLVAGALIAIFGTGQRTFAEEIPTSVDTTVLVSETIESTTTTDETTTDIADTSVENTMNDTETAESFTPMLRSAVAVTGVTDEPKAVENNTTATISTTTETDGLSPADAGRYSYEVHTTLTGEVKEGDYVEYTFDNLPHAGLDGKTVTIADGTVIGTLSKVSETNARTIEMNGTDSQKQALEVGSYDSVYRVVFHNTVENLQDISYSFGLINGNNVWTYVAENSPITSSISANGKEVATYTTTIKGATKENLTKSSLYQSSSQATYTPTGVDGTRLNFNVRNADEVSISAGDTLTATLEDGAGIVFDVHSVKVGQVVTIQDVGSNNVLATVNGNGVLLFDGSKYRFEVVSISENEIVYKALNSFSAVDGRYGGLYTKFIVTDESVIDLANNQLKIPSYISTLTGTDGTVKSTITEPMSIPITGTKIDASAIRVPRANVNVVYVSETGKTLEPQSTVLDDAKVGTAYSTVAKSFDGYRLKVTPTNATGSSTIEDILVTYVYEELKGSVVVKYVDTAGNSISDDVVDMEESSVGVSYDTADHKPTMFLVKNADETVTAYVFKDVSSETSPETGKVVEGETVVTYIYEERAIVPVKDVLNKDGVSVDGGKATVGDVLTFVLDGAPISDGIQGGLWQYDLKDVLDTTKVEYIDGSVKVYAGEFANITLPDGSVFKADDDISSYVSIEYIDGVLTIKPTVEFYTILKENGVEDLVDIDTQFDVKVIADGTIENTFVQVVNGYEFNSNTTTTDAEVPVEILVEPPQPETPKPQAPAKAQLPNTGDAASYSLSIAGVVTLFTSLLGLRKR